MKPELNDNTVALALRAYAAVMVAMVCLIILAGKGGAG